MADGADVKGISLLEFYSDKQTIYVRDTSAGAPFPVFSHNIPTSFKQS